MASQLLLAVSRVSVAFALCFGAAAAQSPAPRIFFSDLDSGPNIGGENGKGAYVTVWGKGFGGVQGSSYVGIGGGRADNYPIWSDTKITFQLGAKAAAGTITVTAAGMTSNGLPFRVQSGKIYFVATTGRDSNSGSAYLPWQTIWKCKQTISPGDICYVKNGVQQNSDDYNAALVIGSPGTASAFKALVIYPGASATIGSNSGQRGIYPCSGLSDCPGSGGSYWIVAGFNIRGSEAVYIHSVHDLKLVANNVQCPNGDGPTACFGADNGQNYRFLGNEVTNAGVAKASKTYHAMYFSTNSNNIEIGWNWIHNNRACRGVQFHSTSGANQYGLSVHDNLIHDIRCNGINFATVDPSKGKVEAYNNVIFNAGIGPDPPDGQADYSCIYIPAFTNAGPQGSGTVDIYNNTLYNCGTWDSRHGGSVTTDTGSAVLTRLRNNILRQDNGTPYLGSGTTLSHVSGSNNLYFGKGNGPRQTGDNINADPQFVNLTTRDFHLQPGSPARDAGDGMGPSTDKDGVIRPQGKAFDIGAYEYFVGRPSASSLGR